MRKLIPGVGSTGLDDGPYLPGYGPPRKKPAPKTAEELRAIRAKAWATRRAKLGAISHAPPSPAWTSPSSETHESGPDPQFETKEARLSPGQGTQGTCQLNDTRQGGVRA
jgi:hypothetical protein